MSVAYYDEHSPNRSDHNALLLPAEVLRLGLVNLFDLELSHPRKKDLTIGKSPWSQWSLRIFAANALLPVGS